MYPLKHITLSTLIFALTTHAAPAPIPIPAPPPSITNNTTPSANSSSSSSSPGYGTLTITPVSPSITRLSINNPPINLWDYKLSSDMSTYISTLAAHLNSSNSSSAPKVVIISSANPDFFIAHYDIHALSPSSPVPPPGNAVDIGAQLLRTRTLLTTLPIIFIAEINGRVSGAGDEIALQCDIRYAGPSALLSQLEVGFGLLPGAGGVQYLTALIGRARALEYMLSGRGVDGKAAAEMGWVNRAFGSGEELRWEVDALAERIAAFPAQGLAAIKGRVNVRGPSEADLAGDNELFYELAGTGVAQRAAGRFLELSGGEREGGFELGVPGDLVEIVS